MPLPAEIQEALGELVGAARDGLLALSVGLGLRVVHDVDGSARSTRSLARSASSDPDRTAKRHGHEDGSMTLGGRRVPVSRPRMRTADDKHELPVQSYEYFADRDPLTRAVMDRMLAGVSTRKFQVVGEPVGEEVEQEASSTSKSTVSELFIERTRTALGELMGRRLDDVRLAVMMLDGLEIADRTHVVALGISTEGVKIPLGLWEGSDGERDAGLDAARGPRRPRPGSRAGDPLRDRRREGTAGARSRTCSASTRWCIAATATRRGMSLTCCPSATGRRSSRGSAARGRSRIRCLLSERLELLASELERTWPDAAVSLREGMDDTLTLMRLGITGQLAKTLCSTNPCESMIEIVRYTQRNVKRWQDGDMRKRWTAAGMLVAEQQFRRIIGYRDLAKLVIAIERHALIVAEKNRVRQETHEPVTV